ncbi:tyrosine-type recombinase/integrase [Deefgea piscis]|uniref:tyrosine-type recombinase/integrase n=1 Tax=Deefgea piscis TaxID=2739061 RepID=UPI001C7F0757|nr:integrase family protein [Deefgea piscis]QZA80694.1 integrase family protein [Deefgea piscis]
MAVKLLSASTIKNAKPGMTHKGKTKPVDKDFLLSDGECLFLRVRPSGTKDWMFIYTASDGSRAKMVLGSQTDHSDKSARDWASEQRALIDAGVDPRTVRAQKKQAEEELKSYSLGLLLKAYVTTLAKRGKVSFREVENALNCHIPEKLRAKNAAAITRDDLIPIIRKLVEDGKGRTAGKVRSYLRTAFEMALTAPDDPNAPSAMLGFKLTHNPVDRIKALSEHNRAGERALSRSELIEFQKHILKVQNVDVRDILRLAILLGGQRFTQLATAGLEKDTEGNPVIVIRDSKGRRQQARRHVLPLQGEALEIVNSRNGQLFCLDAISATDFVKTVSSRVSRISKAMLAEGASTEPFRGGDIRRTVETHLAARGVSSDLRAQLQSHGLGGIQSRHYDKYDYLEEKRTVLSNWEVYLTELYVGNVINLSRKVA